MSRRRVRLVVLAIVVAGCGAPMPSAVPRPSSAVAAVADVCALAPDLRALIGRDTVAPPSSYAVGAAQRCLWVYDRDPSRFVGLTAGGVATHEATVRTLGAGETVEGLGDDARWWAGNRVLSVRRGERAFQVDLQLEPDEATRELAVAVAGQVLATLP